MRDTLGNGLVENGENSATSAELRKPTLLRKRLVVAVTALVVLLLFGLSIAIGESTHGIKDVIAAVTGQADPSTRFTIVDLRLPRAVLGLVAGAAFGLAGTTFQTMLRNPLASPDIIGISAGAAAAAVVAIVFFHQNGAFVAAAAFIGASLTAGALFLLSGVQEFAGTRMILMGIGLAAMLTSLTQWALSQAAAWDLQTAMRWLTGSLNGATWKMVAPLLVAFVVFSLVLALLRKELDILRMGKDTAMARGVSVSKVQGALIFSAVALLSSATAAAGPIAFVAFMSGPIAVRLTRSSAPPLAEAALIGASLVLAADVFAQNLLPARYPVGVVTGLMGAPFLLYLVTRQYQGGTK